MKTIQIKVHKDTLDAHFGIQLAQQTGSSSNDDGSSPSNKTSRIFVEHMDPDSIFMKTDLKVGMELLEIDLHGLGGKSPIDAAKMLQDSPPGDILIVARDHSRRSYSKETMPSMRTIQISISKESTQDPLGLILTQNPNSAQILVKQVLPNGAVARSSSEPEEELLVPGMQITEINLEGLAGKSVVDAVQMLREASGEVMIVARGNVISVDKTNKEQDLGVVFKHKQAAGGASEVVIEKVSSDDMRLFANSGLEPRQKIAAVNGVVLVDPNEEQVLELLQQTPVGQPLTLVTLDSELLQQEHEAPIAPTPEQAPPRQRPSIVLNVDQQEGSSAPNTIQETKATNIVTQSSTPGQCKLQVTGSSGTGISLGMSQEYVYIHKIAPSSPFANTALKVGQHVTKIQGMPCPLSLKKAMDMIAAASPLTLEVLQKASGASASLAAAATASNTAEEPFKEIVAIIDDKETDEDLGITLALTQNYVYVHGMSAKSRFAQTDLCVGHRIVKIDDEECPSSLKDTMDLISQHVGELRIDAYEKVHSKHQVSASLFKKSVISSLGMDVAMSQQGRVVITNLYGPLVSSDLHVGQVVWSINGMKCQTVPGTMRLLESSIGKVSIIASDTVAVAVKKHIDQKAGITVSKKGEGNIVVHKLADDSLFANTDLKVGQKIISICGVACPDNVKGAVGLIQDCVGTCTIVAMDTLPELVQH